MNPTVLVVDDEPEVCQMLRRLLERDNLTVTTAHDAASALRLCGRGSPDLLLADLRLPGMDGLELMRRAQALDDSLPAVLISAYAGVRGAVEAIQAGAHDYLAKPFQHADVLRVVHRALAEREMKLRIRDLAARLRQSRQGLFGPSASAARLVAEVERVAKSDFSVLIVGETGSGKEVVARSIHQASARAEGPFVPLDCGAIPEPLLESELFGHEKGAFTGASSQQMGKFEEARGGTLLLDEIANLPLGSQAKLLRALQDKCIRRLGAARPVRVDARVLAASNQDLEQMVAVGDFRRDLYFRLNEFTVRVPPLRERPEDILFHARQFLESAGAELGKAVAGFTEEASQALQQFAWPGNVRQLRSVVRRATLLAEGPVRREHLELGAETAPPVGAEDWSGLSLHEVVRRSTAQVERDTITQALRQTGGNKAAAARLLRVDYKTMHLKVRQYGITIEKENHGTQ